MNIIYIIIKIKIGNIYVDKIINCNNKYNINIILVKELELNNRNNIEIYKTNTKLK